MYSLSIVGAYRPNTIQFGLTFKVELAVRPEKQSNFAGFRLKSCTRQKKDKKKVSAAKEISADAKVAAVLNIRPRHNFLIIRRTKNTTAC